MGSIRRCRARAMFPFHQLPTPEESQRFGFRLPMIKSSRDANGGGRRVLEFKTDWHRIAAPGDIVVIVIMFH